MKLLGKRTVLSRHLSKPELYTNTDDASKSSSYEEVFLDQGDIKPIVGNK